MSYEIIRWCQSSLTKHFTTTTSTLLYVEGQDRSILKGVRQYAELRIDGPVIKQPSSNHFTLQVEINLLLSQFGQGENIYSIDDLIGEFAAAFTDTISVYRYPDPSTFIDCFKLDKDGTFIARFGVVDPDTSLTQASIEGHYKMALKTLE